MASQLRHLRPNVVRFAHAGCRTSASQVQSCREDRKAWAAANQATSPAHILELEKALCTSVSKIQTLLNQVFGCEHTQNSNDNISTRESAVNTQLSSTSLVAYTDDQCQVTTRRLNKSATDKVASMLQKEKPANTDIESMIDLLDTRQAYAKLTGRGMDHPFVPECNDGYHTHRSSKEKFQNMDHEALDYYFGILKESTDLTCSKQDTYMKFNGGVHNAEKLISSDLLDQINVVSCAPINPDSIENSSLFCSSADSKSDKQPSREQLLAVQEHLLDEIPNFFRRMNYHAYSPDVVFVNNFAQKPYTKMGIRAYIKDIFKIRVYYQFVYTASFVKVLSSSVDDAERSITVRWRYIGMPFLRAAGFRRKASAEVWIDAVSTFYLDDNGVIGKHVVDKIDMLQEEVTKKPNKLEKLIKAKMATSTV